MNETKAEALRRGLNLILYREPDTTISIHANTLHVGDAYSVLYTPDDRAELARLGWSMREESWAFST